MQIRYEVEFVVSVTPKAPASVAKDIEDVLGSSKILNVAFNPSLLYKPEGSENLVMPYKGIVLFEDIAENSGEQLNYGEFVKKINSEVIGIMRRIYAAAPYCANVLVNMKEIEEQQKPSFWDKFWMRCTERLLSHIGKMNYRLGRKEIHHSVQAALEKAYEAVERWQIDEAESLLWSLASSNAITVHEADEILEIFGLPLISNGRNYEATIAISILKDFPIQIIPVIDKLLKPGRILDSIRFEKLLASKKWLTLLYEGVVRCDASITVSELLSRLSQRISEKLETFVTSNRSAFPVDLYQSKVVVFIPRHILICGAIQICSSCVRCFQEDQGWVDSAN